MPSSAWRTLTSNGARVQLTPTVGAITDVWCGMVVWSSARVDVFWLLVVVRSWFWYFVSVACTWCGMFVVPVVAMVVNEVPSC